MVDFWSPEIVVFYTVLSTVFGFPCGASCKELACHCRRHKRLRFDPLGWEDPLEKGMAAHSSILAWRILMKRETWLGYSLWGHKELDMTEVT